MTTHRLTSNQYPYNVVDAARALLARIDDMTTAEFERGAERPEREALPDALACLLSGAAPEPTEPARRGDRAHLDAPETSPDNRRRR